MKFCLDPGHGGRDSGAIGVTGLRECDVNLDLSHRVALILHSLGQQVSFTRTADSSLTPKQRLAGANASGADVLLSIHCNSADNPAARGFEVWTSPGQTKADPIATAIYGELSCLLHGIPGRKDMTDGDPDKEARFYLLTKTQMPAVLAESLFLSNPEDELALRDLGVLTRLAEAYAWGLVAGSRHCKLQTANCKLP
jgi:N-acetylmuramoyl-L-alanine amidase